MLIGEPDPDPCVDGTPLLPLLAEAGARVEGLRLTDGRLVVKVQLRAASLQILVPSRRVFDPRDEIMVKVAESLPLEMIVTRIEEFWTGRAARPLGKGGSGGVQSIGFV